MGRPSLVKNEGLFPAPTVLFQSGRRTVLFQSLQPIPAPPADHPRRRSLLQRQEIKRKLRELMDPTSSLTVEPMVPIKLKGRPKGSYKKFQQDIISTKREPSLFEHVLQAEEKKLQSKIKTLKSGNRMLQRVRKQMPTSITNYIMDTVDVMGDGHCGYRVISLAMDMGDDWQGVRIDLLGEIQRHESLYIQLYGHERKETLFSSLDSTVVPAPLDKWMTMPDMGMIVASCYNIRLVHFSEFQSFTFLPLHSAPPTFPKTIYIGFINGNHFVQLLVRDDCPLPPIFPSWKKYCLQIATKWDLHSMV